MDHFRTRLPEPALPLRISYRSHILSMGSCFAEEMGNRLKRLKFTHLLNPFGITYHPLLLAAQLDELSGRRQPTDLAASFAHQGVWRHYAFHSRLARVERAELLQVLEGQLRQGSEFLSQTDVLILTFGSAYGYRLRSSGEWVNNCHKQAADHFQKERAAVSEIVETLGSSLAYLRNLRPELQVLLSVSPVRHLRDGIQANQRSKAILLLATEALCEAYEFVHYFPAYEYLLDELRDYRFYGPDMLHPSPTAVDYIWTHFTQACWDDQTHKLAKRIEKLVQAAEHLPLHPASAASAAFRAQQQKAILKLQEECPALDFSRELALLQKKD